METFQTVEEAVEQIELGIQGFVFTHLNNNPNYTRKEMVNLVNIEIEKQLIKTGAVMEGLKTEDFLPVIKKVVYQLVAP